VGTTQAVAPRLSSAGTKIPLLTIAVTLTALLYAVAQAHAQQPTTPLKPARTGYAPANGVNYYYEIYGRAGRGHGTPLLVLHGGLGSTAMFEPDLAQLSKGRQVIAVDLHGHGRTALGDRAINYTDMGNDLAAVLKQLGYDTVDVLGYSMGGGVALRLAIQHPDVVRRLVLVSTPYSPSGFYPELLPQQAAVSAAMADAMKETPMYKSYVAVAPRPQDFPRLLDQMGAWMRQAYDWSEDVKKLRGPVMLVYGDADMIRPEHIVAFYQLLGGGLKDAGWQREHMSPNRLAILPNVTHYDMVLSPALVPTVLPFLNGEK
jgi:pimeloyl-ACP methyl ester carboxylesterase